MQITYLRNEVRIIFNHWLHGDCFFRDLHVIERTSRMFPRRLCTVDFSFRGSDANLAGHVVLS